MEFNNSHIKRFPEPRDYYYVYHKGKNFTFELCKVSMEQVRKECRLVKVLGDWDNMQVWIDNFWEALYNPVWLLQRVKLGVLHGHHRTRLLDAMDANHIWCYVVDKKITSKVLPRRVRGLMRRNNRNPKYGNRSGVCVKCGKKTRFKKRTFNKVADVRMYCLKC